MIQTVTGPISPTASGPVLMHEHISCASLSFTRAFGSLWLDKEKLKALACETLQQTQHAYQLSLLVDGTPIDLGRDAALLKEVSELSGIPIVASTGFYSYDSLEALQNTPEDLAGWLLRECREGIEGTGIKPGILKCATGSAGITKDNHKKLSAMGILQAETNLPLYVHCFHRENIAMQQLEIFFHFHCNPEKIIIGHTAIRRDPEYLQRILDMGCYICMDQNHCFDSKLPEIARSLLTLCQKGYRSRLLVANDYCIHSDFGNQKTTGMQLSAQQHVRGLGYALEKLQKEFLSAGGSETDWTMMLCQNPLDVLNG